MDSSGTSEQSTKVCYTNPIFATNSQKLFSFERFSLYGTHLVSPLSLCQLRVVPSFLGLVYILSTQVLTVCR